MKTILRGVVTLFVALFLGGESDSARADATACPEIQALSSSSEFFVQISREEFQSQIQFGKGTDGSIALQMINQQRDGGTSLVTGTVPVGSAAWLRVATGELRKSKKVALLLPVPSKIYLVVGFLNATGAGASVILITEPQAQSGRRGAALRTHNWDGFSIVPFRLPGSGIEGATYECKTVLDFPGARASEGAAWSEFRNAEIARAFSGRSVQSARTFSFAESGCGTTKGCVAPVSQLYEANASLEYLLLDRSLVELPTIVREVDSIRKFLGVRRDRFGIQRTFELSRSQLQSTIARASGSAYSAVRQYAKEVLSSLRNYLSAALRKGTELSIRDLQVLKGKLERAQN